MSDAPQLNPDEDDELRLLHSLKGFGAVAHSMASRYDVLRRRDRRNIVREPDETKVATPIEKKMWADPVRGSHNPDGDPTMADTREIVPRQGEPKKGGFFRR